MPKYPNLTEWQLAVAGGLSQEEYNENKRRAAEEKERLLRVVEDPHTPPEVKHDTLCRIKMYHSRSVMRCPTCWLLPSKDYCCCDTWQRAETRHQIIIYMHHNEWGRNNNSGITLATCLGARIFVSGLRDHEEALQSLLHSYQGRAVLLWPGDRDGEDASQVVPIDELASTRPQALEQGLAVVAVDASWRNARSMVRRLPSDLLRVCLPVGSHLPEEAARRGPPGSGTSILRPVRRYAGEDARVSTLEAVVGLLRGAGEPPETCDAMLSNLQLKVDRCLRQNTSKDAFKNHPTRQKKTGKPPPASTAASASTSASARAHSLWALKLRSSARSQAAPQRTQHRSPGMTSLRGARGVWHMKTFVSQIG